MSKKKKLDVKAIAIKVNAVKELEKQKLLKVIPTVNRIELETELWFGKDEKFKKNYINNIIFVYRLKKILEENTEINVFDINSKELIAKYRKGKVKFL